MCARCEPGADDDTFPIQRLSRYLSERSPQPMVAVEGTTHVVIYLNPAFALLVGRDRGDLVGRPFAEAVPEGDENGCLALLNRVFHTGEPENLAEQEHRQERDRPVYWSYAVWAILGEDERPTGVMIQITDATAMATFRQQVVAMNEALVVSGARQHDLTGEAVSLNARLQAAVDTRDRFLAVLSHELRTPLAAIRNAVTLATRSRTAEDIDWCLDVTGRQVKNFAHLIEDLLDISRISQGKIQLRKAIIDAGDVLRHAAETVKPIVEAKKHKLLLSSTNLKIEADPTRLEQMLVNLLMNAAKYTPTGGRIELTAGAEGRNVVFRVRDNGVGIASDLLPTMFDLFVQADCSLDRAEGGLGIGLTLVRSLATLHGGTVTATSDGPGRGSEFVMAFPLSAVEERDGPGPNPQKASQVSQARRCRVLVVDDSRDTANGMAKLLKFSGHDVQVAYDGEEAINLARVLRPEVIILDIGLPGINGYELATTLRREDWGKDAVMIAITGYGEARAQERSKHASINHHLTKPIAFDTVLALINDAPHGK